MLSTKDVITSYATKFEVNDISAKICQLPKDIIYATVISAIQQSKADVAAVINFWLSAIAKTNIATDLVIVMESIIIADIGLTNTTYYNFLINHNLNRILTISDILDRGFSLLLINNYARAKIANDYKIEAHLQQRVKTAIEQFNTELCKTICVNKVDSKVDVVDSKVDVVDSKVDVVDSKVDVEKIDNYSNFDKIEELDTVIEKVSVNNEIEKQL
jgi:hypothetical protein